MRQLFALDGDREHNTKGETMVTMTSKQCWEAEKTLTRIINDRVRLPQTTRYKIARLHLALHSSAQTFEAARVEIVKELSGSVVVDHGLPTERYQVPDEKMAEYDARVKELGTIEIEVEVQPLPIVAFGDDGGVEALEFRTLIEAGLITDN